MPVNKSNVKRNNNKEKQERRGGFSLERKDEGKDRAGTSEARMGSWNGGRIPFFFLLSSAIVSTDRPSRNRDTARAVEKDLKSTLLAPVVALRHEEPRG